MQLILTIYVFMNRSWRRAGRVARTTAETRASIYDGAKLKFIITFTHSIVSIVSIRCIDTIVEVCTCTCRCMHVGS